MKTTFASIPRALVAVLTVLGLSGMAQAAPVVLTLPGGLVDGLPPQQFDQALVYSASLLTQQQAAGKLPGNTSNFSFASGSGTLGVIVYTSNSVANPAGYQAPMDALNSGDFDGTWGMGMTGTVGLIRQYLTLGGTSYQPLFVFDHNENAQNPDLLISGRVAVYRGASQIASFSLDTNANGSYDIDARVTSCGSPYIGPAAPTPYDNCNIPAPTTSGTTYHWDTNGSGKPDYFAVIPTFDLYDGLFLDTDSFVVQMSIRGNEHGFEELAIAGYKFASTNDVPEPGSLALLGLSLALLATAMAKRRSAKHLG